MSDVDLTPEQRDLILRRLLELAREADEAGDEGKARMLLDARWLIRAGEAGGPQPRMVMREFKHQARMDFVRQLMAAFLILVLFMVILAGVIKDQSGAEIAQFAAPVSGLAGIGIGWLFTGRGVEIQPGNDLTRLPARAAERVGVYCSGDVGRCTVVPRRRRRYRSPSKTERMPQRCLRGIQHPFRQR